MGITANITELFADVPESKFNTLYKIMILLDLTLSSNECQHEKEKIHQFS